MSRREPEPPPFDEAVAKHFEVANDTQRIELLWSLEAAGVTVLADDGDTVVARFQDESLQHVWAQRHQAWFGWAPAEREVEPA